MTFIPQDQIEARAAELWRQHGLSVGFDVERLLDDLGLDLLWESLPASDDGVVLGQLIPKEKLVVLNEAQRERLEQAGGRQRRYTVGHELGHWTLHSDAARSGTLSLFDGRRVLCRDKSAHPVERQAEKFAAALLMPREELRPALPVAPWRGWRHVYDLADRFVVTPTAMAVRLEELGWMHRDEDDVPSSGRRVPAGQGSLFL
jgi:hypothetical protein